ncbi:hypothetical protein [Halalkalibacter wakoensis]|uniref:hypothetical protein n=1 Tax=Halalkalibacter wakoensis TaxID=127891 RepID=UPI000B233C3C|nr:hypothetical protein [Halalkalibacter wakoensis]
MQTNEIKISKHKLEKTERKQIQDSTICLGTFNDYWFWGYLAGVNGSIRSS